MSRPPITWFAPPAGTLSRASTPMPGVVLQVADSDPAKWQLAIDQATAILDPEAPRSFDVVVVAHGPGLGMLRSGSPVSAAVHESLARGIRFVACGNTMERGNVAAHELLPGVTVARSGASLEILALERAGYAYVRI
jgi:intracellular sulfur oxidation DsrE/DsrF family protein